MRISALSTAALAALLCSTSLLTVQAQSGAAQSAAADDPVASIDRYREAVENELRDLERRPVSLMGARPQVKQKWRSMDAYLRDGEVVRIKLYPHQGISRRTEEFYYRDGRVVLAFVEDEGAETRGASPTRTGKTYYFSDGRLVRELNKTGEAEVLGPAADSARLLQEAQEFLALATGTDGDGHANEHEQHHGRDANAGEEHHR